MNLLLDTHTFVWAVGDPSKLSGRAMKALQSPKNELAVSAASAWELAIKFKLGRMPEAEVLLTRFESTAAELGAVVLPIRANEAIFAGTMAWEHRDPVDRMLAAQALGENLTFVTRDRAFDDVRSLKTLW